MGKETRVGSGKIAETEEGATPQPSKQVGNLFSDEASQKRIYKRKRGKENEKIYGKKDDKSRVNGDID